MEERCKLDALRSPGCGTLARFALTAWMADRVGEITAGSSKVLRAMKREFALIEVEHPRDGKTDANSVAQLSSRRSSSSCSNAPTASAANSMSAPSKSRSSRGCAYPSTNVPIGLPSLP